MSEASARASGAAQLPQAASAMAAADQAAERMTSIALDEQPLPEEEDASDARQASFGTLATLDVNLDSGGNGDIDDAQLIFHSSKPAAPFQATASVSEHQAVSPSDRSPGLAPTDRQLSSAASTGSSSGGGSGNVSDVQVGGLTSSIDAKFGNLLRWGERTFRSTKQLVREQLSGGWRTIDAELEVQVALLKDTQHKYVRLVTLTRELMTHLRSVVETQERLSMHLAELAVKSPELHDDFRLNADSQNSVAKNGRKLLVALDSFVAGVRTLCNKTIADTLMTFDRYQNARLAFDAYRHDYEMLVHERSTPGALSKAEAAKADYEANKATFERLREDVMIKLRLLDENKVKVMHRQMIMYHAAIVSYFSGDQDQLDATLAQFSVRDVEPTQVAGAK